MACQRNGLLRVLPFMAGGVVHDHDTLGRQLGQHILFHPSRKNIGIHMGSEQANSQEATPYS